MKRTILFLTVTLIFVFFPMKVLVISSEGNIEEIVHIEEGEMFSIRWIHSVEDEEWEEFFKVKKNSIVLDATRFKTFGAGVPNDVGKDSYIKDGWLYMVDIDRRIDDLYIRTNDMTNHQLIYKDVAYQLSDQHAVKAYKIEWTFIHLYQLLTVH
jgi:hypothetical protein